MTLHIRITKSLNDEFLNIAKSQQATQTEVARRAIEAYLKNYQRKKTFEDVQRYAEEMAEYSGEFVK